MKPPQCARMTGNTTNNPAIIAHSPKPTTPARTDKHSCTTNTRH
jgi:hypothetical protein